MNVNIVQNLNKEDQAIMKKPSILFISMVLAGCMLIHAAPCMAQKKAGGHPAVSDGVNEISFHIGGQAHIWGWAPGGFKMFFDYGRKLTSDLWLNFQFNLTFGRRWGYGERCYVDDRDRLVCRGYDSRYYSGSSGEFVGGVKWKFFPFEIPFMFYAKAGGMLAVLSWPHQWGFAMGGRGGGGFKYFFTPNVSVGVESNLSLGFSYLEDRNWRWAGYTAFDTGVGMEFIF